MLREIWKFISRHWPHMLLVPPGVLIITLVHESAHAAAVLLQGGTINEFVWLPVGDKWGYITYDLPAWPGFSSFFVSIAPYLLWFFLAAVAILLSLLLRPVPFWAASSLYLWLFVAPLADVANTAFPYLAGRRNDFTSAFGPPMLEDELLTALLCMLILATGHFVQRRLYGTQALGLPAYLVLSLTAMGAIVLLTFGAPGSHM